MPKPGRSNTCWKATRLRVVSVSFLDSGRLLASLGENGAVIFWRTDTWAEVLRVEKIGEAISSPTSPFTPRCR